MNAVDRLGTLTELIPGHAVMSYLGCVCKRLIEPYLVRYETFQAAKTQQAVFNKYPLKRLEFCRDLMSSQSVILSEAAEQALDNLLKIGEKAESFIRGDEQCKNISVDKDIDLEWMNRFVDGAGYVSDDKLQELCGRLLKEKMVRPHAVNKRVMDIIFNIDASELDTIQNYMSCFVGDAIAADIMVEFDFGLNMMLELQNIGLMSIVNAPTVFNDIYSTEDITPAKNIIVAKGYNFVFSDITEPFTVEIKSYTLTKEDKIVYNLLSAPMREDVALFYLKKYKAACVDKATVKLVKTAQ